MTKITEREVNVEDLPDGRILPGDARHGEFLTGSMLCQCGHLGSRHGMEEPVTVGAITRYSYNCADCDCERLQPNR